MLKLQPLGGPPEAEGYRLLVAREWPAGFPESGADGFNPQLAPSTELYEELMNHKIGFEQFAARYGKELEGQNGRLARLAKQAKDFDIILVTYPDFEGKSIGQILLDACAKAAQGA
jgi:uncharacterized protein YeaO (DUF488 family)